MSKILLVEDDHNIAEALKTRLEHEGHEVHWAEEAAKGYEDIATFQPDLLLLDLLTKSIHGLDILEKVRKESVLPNLPCIVITNVERDEYKERAFKLGVDAFIIKAQSSLEEMVDAVHTALDVH